MCLFRFRSKFPYPLWQHVLFSLFRIVSNDGGTYSANALLLACVSCYGGALDPGDSGGDGGDEAVSVSVDLRGHEVATVLDLVHRGLVPQDLSPAVVGWFGTMGIQLAGKKFVRLSSEGGEGEEVEVEVDSKEEVEEVGTEKVKEEAPDAAAENSLPLEDDEAFDGEDDEFADTGDPEEDDEFDWEDEVKEEEEEEECVERKRRRKTDTSREKSFCQACNRAVGDLEAHNAKRHSPGKEATGNERKTTLFSYAGFQTYFTIVFFKVQ